MLSPQVRGRSSTNRTIVINIPREGKLHVYHRWLFFEWIIQANTKCLLSSVPLPTPPTPPPHPTGCNLSRRQLEIKHRRRCANTGSLHVWLALLCSPLGKKHCLWPWARCAIFSQRACDKYSNCVEHTALSTWESAHQADMQIIIWLKREKDREMFGEEKLLAQQGCLRTSPRPWPWPGFLCRFVLILGNCVRIRAGWMCLCVSARGRSVARAIPQVSDIWSPGLIGPRRAWHSARTIMPQARPARLRSGAGWSLCSSKLIRPARTTWVEKGGEERPG